MRPSSRGESPKLTCVGRVRDVIQFGAESSAVVGGDTGEPRKQMGVSWSDAQAVDHRVCSAARFLM